MSEPKGRELQELREQALTLRERLGLDTMSPVDAFLIQGLERDKLTLVRYPLGSAISGMCIKGIGGIVIAVNSTMSLGRQNFSVAHEFYHMYYDDSSAQTVCPTAIGTGSPVERRADQFASYFLMPPDALSAAIARLPTGRVETVADVVALEQLFRVSRLAMLFRLTRDGKVSAEQAAQMRAHVIMGARALGYDTSLYEALPGECQREVRGYYFVQLDRLHKKDLISEGRYQELLNDVFRSGAPEEAEDVD